jgi:uncharacterized protein
VIRYLVAGLIRLYQKTLSRLIGPVCRFEPSCSQYALACVKEHGAFLGSLLSLVRLCKCHPFHPGGYDPPPPRGKSLRPWAILFPGASREAPPLPTSKAP